MGLEVYEYSFESNPRAVFRCLAHNDVEARLLLSDFMTRLSWGDHVRDGGWTCVAREVVTDANAVSDRR